MITVYLALGSNVGDSAQYIAKAIQLLGSSIYNIKQAPLYASRAIGYTNQANYLNTAISGQTELPPQDLMDFINKVEQQVGRVKRFRWGPREIDIDIIFYGNQVLKTEALTVPHKRFRERDFVLQPLVDLNGDVVDPLSQKTVGYLLTQLDPALISIIHKV
jgi:2-amino-4-hydroxy-6-hydroxymethyldihydropteridine diphosphokinase